MKLAPTGCDVIGMEGGEAKSGVLVMAAEAVLVCGVVGTSAVREESIGCTGGRREAFPVPEA